LYESKDKGIEMFTNKEKRVFGTISHPDYNRAFMQEQVLGEYFKRHLISEEFNYRSYL
jgi:hypothetical protein